MLPSFSIKKELTFLIIKNDGNMWWLHVEISMKKTEIVWQHDGNMTVT